MHFSNVILSSVFGLVFILNYGYSACEEEQRNLDGTIGLIRTHETICNSIPENCNEEALQTLNVLKLSQEIDLQNCLNNAEINDDENIKCVEERQRAWEIYGHMQECVIRIENPDGHPNLYKKTASSNAYCAFNECQDCTLDDINERNEAFNQALQIYNECMANDENNSTTICKAEKSVVKIAELNKKICENSETCDEKTKELSETNLHTSKIVLAACLDQNLGGNRVVDLLASDILPLIGYLFETGTEYTGVDENIIIQFLAELIEAESQEEGWCGSFVGLNNQVMTRMLIPDYWPPDELSLQYLDQIGKKAMGLEWESCKEQSGRAELWKSCEIHDNCYAPGASKLECDAALFMGWAQECIQTFSGHCLGECLGNVTLYEAVMVAGSRAAWESATNIPVADVTSHLNIVPSILTPLLLN